MKRPPTYARMGTAVVKRADGFIYMVQDVNPLLDEVDKHIKTARDSQKQVTDANIEIARLGSEMTDKDHQIDDLTRELREANEYLEESRSAAESYAEQIAQVRAFISPDQPRPKVP